MQQKEKTKNTAFPHTKGHAFCQDFNMQNNEESTLVNAAD